MVLTGLPSRRLSRLFSSVNLRVLGGKKVLNWLSIISVNQRKSAAKKVFRVLANC
jgi:hypothetical protein